MSPRVATKAELRRITLPGWPDSPVLLTEVKFVPEDFDTHLNFIVHTDERIVEAYARLFKRHYRQARKIYGRTPPKKFREIHRTWKRTKLIQKEVE